MDKAFWLALVEDDYAIPVGHSAASLAPELLSLLGSADAELRDGVAYATLATWLARGYYTPAEIWALAEQLAANLAIGLGERESDSVFLRSFSALMLAEIVHRDNKGQLLEQHQVNSLLERALAYLPAEQDLRGYVPGKSWAHAAAHSADLLWLLALSRHIGAVELRRMLDALAAKAVPPGPHIYLYNEDQRLARAALGAIGRDLVDPGFLKDWLERVVHPGGRAIGVEGFFAGLPPAIADPDNLALLHNTAQFLRALHFHLAHDEEPPACARELLPLVVEALRPMNSC